MHVYRLGQGIADMSCGVGCPTQRIDQGDAKERVFIDDEYSFLSFSLIESSMTTSLTSFI
jgi:hypothetical protein